MENMLFSKTTNNISKAKPNLKYLYQCIHCFVSYLESHLEALNLFKIILLSRSVPYKQVVWLSFSLRILIS